MIMASGAEPSYQRLKQEMGLHEGETKRSWKKRRVRVGRRVRVRVKMPSCKEYLLLGRKGSLVKMVWTKIWKRLKESNSHFGDLFAGNYVFAQVTPTPLINHRTTHAFLAYS